MTDDIDYNTMIKQNIKYDMVDVTREVYLESLNI